MPNKKNTPGCPCCTPTGCNVTINVVACCGPASGATVTIKDGSGTVKGTGTTNSSGSVTISLAGTSGQTLYVFISYDTTHYQTYSGVILGNHCGRTYQYTLDTVTDTYGTSCGQVIVKTFGCDGTTPYGGINVALYQSGISSPIASGTTDATTGIYTFSGLSTSYSYYVKAGPTPRSQPAQTTSTFTLTCSEEVDFTFNPTYPFVPTGTSCPASYTLASLSGGSYKRSCCATCGSSSIPGVLTLSGVPYSQAYRKRSSDSWSLTGGCASMKITNGSRFQSPCQRVFWFNDPAYPCCSGVIPSANLPAGSTWFPNGFAWTYNAVYLLCDRSQIALTLFFGAITPTCNGAEVYAGNAVFNGGVTVAASSVTCSPFAATFNFPDIGGSTLTWLNGGISTCSEFPSNLFPAFTCTVTE